MSRVFFLLVLVYSVSGQNIDDVEYIHNDCTQGVQIITQKKFIIQSNHYPKHYPLNYRCSYLVKGPKCPTTITLKFLDFDVEDSADCSKDRFEIVNREPICGRTEGVRKYYTQKGSLNLKFVSDGDGTGRGYKILVTRNTCHGTIETVTQTSRPQYAEITKFHYLVTTESSNIIQNEYASCCQRVNSNRQFTLTSPNFPYSMTIPTECVFEISKYNDKVCSLEISVKYFSMGNTINDCSQGFLEIDNNYICGCGANVKFTSSFTEGSSKLLRFVSKGQESNNAESGFVLEVTQVECSGGDREDRFISFFNRKGVDANARTSSKKRSYQKIVDYGSNSEINNLFVKDDAEYNYCLGWNKQQFNFLLQKGLPTCKTSENNRIEVKNCISVDYLQGFLQSPGYPFNYPENLTLCYQFKKQPGYCSVLLDIKYFHVENSPNCENDYLLLPNQQKCCGETCPQKIFVDLRNKPFENIYFVTDPFSGSIKFTSKGYFISYNQISCENDPNHLHAMPKVSCSRLDIREAEFTLEVSGNEHICEFKIKKNSPKICVLALDFENFDLVCGAESLIVDKTIYCGDLKGQSVKVMMDKDIDIIYHKHDRVNVNGLRFSIKGSQESNDCLNYKI